MFRNDFGLALLGMLISSLIAAGCGDDDAEGSNVDLTWVKIPGWTFQMGSTGGDSDETPVHGVKLPGFEMTKSEVTVTQYAECVSAGACTMPSTSASQCNWEQSGYEDHPVNCVSRDQALSFCEWAGGRLPSEAEWEYAARSGGQDITYPWGDAEATCDYAVMDDNTHNSGCDTGRTWSVCSKTKGNTSQGLCDMVGNVWEWVEDDYHSSYAGAPEDGSAWIDAPRGSFRVIRGGSFGSGPLYLRAADRGRSDPANQFGDYGFRCAR